MKRNSLARGTMLAMVMAIALGWKETAWGQVGALRLGLQSPTAASLGKYGEIPVNLYTGSPNINIPLFELRGRTLSLPISLSYHASGVRVEEIPGWVGMGWALNAGGVITRTVRALPDEHSQGYISTGNQLYTSANWPHPSQQYYERVKAQTVDPEPDQFFFNFAGQSGKFVFGENGQIYPIPYRKAKFEYVRTGNPLEITKWTITTEDGTQYVFDALEKTTDRPQGWSSEGNEIRTHVSSWYLTKIIAPGGVDEITLVYTAPTMATYSLQVYEERFHNTIGTECNRYRNSTVWNAYDLGVRYLQSVVTSNYTAMFNTSLRTDAPQERKLDDITIKIGNQIIKTFRFGYGYHAGPRLRLERITEEGSDGSQLSPHLFTYDSGDLPDRLSRSIDHWGYYNGKPNSTLIPAEVDGNPIWSYSSPLVYFDGANRKPDFTYGKGGILTRIDFPTGGNTQFVYEAHDYGFVTDQHVTTDSDGLDRYSIVQSENGVMSVTPFHVGGVQAVSVAISISMDPEYSYSAQEHYVEVRGDNGASYLLTSRSQVTHLVLSPGSYRLFAVSEGPGSYAHIDATWQEVIAVKKKPAGGLRIKRIESTDRINQSDNVIQEFQYRMIDDPDRSSGVLVTEPRYSYKVLAWTCAYTSRSAFTTAPLGMTQGSPLGYAEVTVLQGENGRFGKTRSFFSSPLMVHDFFYQPEWWPLAGRTSFDWQRGHLLRIDQMNSSGVLQKETLSQQFYNDPTGPNWFSSRGVSFNQLMENTMESITLSGRYEVHAAWMHLQAEISVAYDTTGQNPVMTTTNYHYDNPNHLQMTRSVEVNSDGTERITQMSYPLDYTAATSGSTGAMQALFRMKTDKHMHSVVIEKVVLEKKLGMAQQAVSGDLLKFKVVGNQILPAEALRL